jgi:hypothetical protein
MRKSGDTRAGDGIINRSFAGEAPRLQAGETMVLVVSHAGVWKLAIVKRLSMPMDSMSYPSDGSSYVPEAAAA